MKPFLCVCIYFKPEQRDGMAADSEKICLDVWKIPSGGLCLAKKWLLAVCQKWKESEKFKLQLGQIDLDMLTLEFFNNTSSSY